MKAENSNEKPSENAESKASDDIPKQNEKPSGNAESKADDKPKENEKTICKVSEVEAAVVATSEGETPGHPRKINEKSSNDASATRENEVEDVPQDFFDDFSNPDFMEGLNIVDAWDDGPEKDQSSKESEKKSPGTRRNKRRRSPERRRRSRSREKREDNHRSKDTNPKRSSSGKLSTSSKKEKSKEEIDIRRDPTKSRRDLEKYRVKCDKDKEQKTITEKLKVVETGLVPPGMEMDVDLEEVMKQAKRILEKEKQEKQKCPELDDQWQSNPASVTGKIIYPDLKPSAVLPEKDLRRKLRRQRSKSGEKSLRRSRKSLEHKVSLPNADVSSERRRKRSPERQRRSASTDRVYRAPISDRRRVVSPTTMVITKDINKRRSLERQRSIPRERLRLERSISRERLRLERGVSRERLRLERSVSRERLRSERSISRERLRRNMRSRSRGRRSSSRGRRRRSRSRNLSEREAWMRDPKRAWRKSRSRSPKRKRYDDKKEKKISFLEEIHQLLSGTVPVQHGVQHAPQHPPHPAHMATPHSMLVPLPAPVPAPLPVPPPVNQFNFARQQSLQTPVDMYDQQFFIGDNNTAQPVLPAPHPRTVLGPQVKIPGPPDPVPCPIPKLGNQFQNTNNVIISNKPNSISPINKPNTTSTIAPKNNSEPVKQTPLEKCLADLKNSFGPISGAPMAKEVKAAAKAEVQKLYEEKKITLSEFLSMTTKLEDYSTSTTNLPKKIQVISRCQEVVKQLGAANVTSGRLILRRKIRQKSPDAEHTSPLLRKPVAYKGTTAQRQQKESYTKKLNSLLVSTGVSDTDIFDEDEENTTPCPPAPPSIGPRTRNNVAVGMSTCTMPSRFLSKMVQTDPIKCEECEIRNDIIYIHSASQCSVSVNSIGVQATEDPIKEMLKNKPMAALTPAQLLMKEKDQDRGHLIEERRLGFPGNHDFGYGLNKFREGQGASRLLQFSPPRRVGSPPRRLGSPPRRLGSPPVPIHDRAVPYVPGQGPAIKRPIHPMDYYFDENNPDRYFRR